MARLFRKYTITITRSDEVEAERREWKQVADSGNERDDGPVYEYVTYPGVEHESTDILKQEIRDEGLDIKAVIRAINGI